MKTLSLWAGVSLYLGYVVLLYHVSAKSMPLPKAKNQAWLNAPATWSPDGVHLAYFVKDEVTGEGVLLTYQTMLDLVWEMDRSVDTAIKPAWSWPCLEGLRQGCHLAYGRKGSSKTEVVSLNLETNWSENWSIKSGRGHILKWSLEDVLYYGRLEWFQVQNDHPIVSRPSQIRQMALSPKMACLVYVDHGPLKVQRTVWLKHLSTGQTSLVYPRTVSQAASNGLKIFWSTQGIAFAFFEGDRLWSYKVQQEQGQLYAQPIVSPDQTSSLDLLKSGIFSPTEEAFVVVEGLYRPNPERPQQRLVMIDETGARIILRPWSQSPIVLLAWLPNEINMVSSPYPMDGFVKRFQ